MTTTNPVRPRGHKNNLGGYTAYLNTLPEDQVGLVAPVPVNAEQSASLDAILEDVYDVPNRTEARDSLLLVDFWEPDEDGCTEFVTRVVLNDRGQVEGVLLQVTNPPDVLSEGAWLDVADEDRGRSIRDAVGARVNPLPAAPNAKAYGTHIEQLQGRGRLPRPIAPYPAGAYVDHWLRENPEDSWELGDQAELIGKAADAYEGTFESPADFARVIAVRYDNVDLDTPVAHRCDWAAYADDLLTYGFFGSDGHYFRNI